MSAAKRSIPSPVMRLIARSIVEELVRGEQVFMRTTNAPTDRVMWGSSLGGVVSFYTVWQYPEVFGGAICMSSTFSYKDDLIERVLTEPKRNVGFYLDSGWPGDNYEVTVADGAGSGQQRLALRSRSPFIYVFRAPRTMRKRGGCDYICRCSCLPAPSRARRAAASERLIQIPADRLQRDLPGCRCNA